MRENLTDKAEKKEGLCTSARTLARCRNCQIREDTVAGVLTLDELDKLDAIMISRNFGAGSTIFVEGDTAKSYYNIYDGVVRLIKLLPDGRRAVLGFLFKGDFFGLPDDGVYAYSAEAVSPVKMCCFPIEKMERLFEEMPKLEHSLLGKMMGMLSRSQNRMAELARKSPRERLAAFIINLSAVSGIDPDTGVFPVPMSREDISDYLGLTIETVSRTFSAFAREGLIAIEGRRHLKIRDKNALIKISEGIE